MICDWSVQQTRPVSQARNVEIVLALSTMKVDFDNPTPKERHNSVRICGAAQNLTATGPYAEALGTITKDIVKRVGGEPETLGEPMK